MIIEQDSIFGYVCLGNIRQSGSDKGIPYSSAFNHVNGFYKADMQPMTQP
ncbi:MAG: hypothetical protein ACK4K0_09125 [Flavobacteriales bacterium]